MKSTIFALNFARSLPAAPENTGERSELVN